MVSWRRAARVSTNAGLTSLCLRSETRLIGYLVLVIASAAMSAQAPSLELNFTASAPSFQPATEDTVPFGQRKPRIVAAMEQATGLRFESGPIDVGVYEGTSLSGIRGVTPMRMRASYSLATKRATLVHELAHR